MSHEAEEDVIVVRAQPRVSRSDHLLARIRELEHINGKLSRKLYRARARLTRAKAALAAAKTGQSQPEAAVPGTRRRRSKQRHKPAGAEVSVERVDATTVAVQAVTVESHEKGVDAASKQQVPEKLQLSSTEASDAVTPAQPKHVELAKPASDTRTETASPASTVSGNASASGASLNFAPRSPVVLVQGVPLSSFLGRKKGAQLGHLSKLPQPPLQKLDTHGMPPVFANTHSKPSEEETQRNSKEHAVFSPKSGTPPSLFGQATSPSARGASNVPNTTSLFSAEQVVRHAQIHQRPPAAAVMPTTLSPKPLVGSSLLLRPQMHSTGPATPDENRTRQQEIPPALDVLTQDPADYIVAKLGIGPTTEEDFRHVQGRLASLSASTQSPAMPSDLSAADEGDSGLHNGARYHHVLPNSSTLKNLCPTKWIGAIGSLGRRPPSAMNGEEPIG